MPDPVLSAPATALPSDALDFIRTPGRYATVATVDPDGRPHPVLVWYRLDGSTIVLNSLVGRRWPTNIVRDRWVSVLVSDGHDWVSVGGTVEIVEEQATAQADIATMARAYDPPDQAAEAIARFRTQRRISFRLHPERVHTEIGE